PNVTTSTTPPTTQIHALYLHDALPILASRPIKFSEKMKLKAAKQEVEEVIIAYDALAVIVNPSNPVSQLTRQQLEAIFRGKITKDRKSTRLNSSHVSISYAVFCLTKKK